MSTSPWRAAEKFRPAIVSGFFPAVASSIRRIDGCLGSFIDFLKRTNRYDNSIVILTADHGDSLGEEGRWATRFSLCPK
jgi:arylsulfatase A-like enzyme